MYQHQLYLVKSEHHRVKCDIPSLDFLLPQAFSRPALTWRQPGRAYPGRATPVVRNSGAPAPRGLADSPVPSQSRLPRAPSPRGRSRRGAGRAGGRVHDGGLPQQRHRLGGCRWRGASTSPEWCWRRGRSCGRSGRCGIVSLKFVTVPLVGVGVRGPSDPCTICGEVVVIAQDG